MHYGPVVFIDDACECFLLIPTRDFSLFLSSGLEKLRIENYDSPFDKERIDMGFHVSQESKNL